MSTKGRIKFAVSGMHPHLIFLRDVLIRRGLACVPIGEKPDFLLVGGLAAWNEHFDTSFGQDKPVILLSDDSMYSDKDFEFNIRDKVAMKEDDPIFLPSPLDQKVAGTLRYLAAENHFLASRGRTMVLRIFNVYGPSFMYGVVADYMSKASLGHPLRIFNPGYQTRTYLHEVDFVDLFEKMVTAFLEGARGIYNVGSPEETSIKRLGDSVWQFTHGPGSEVKSELVRSPRSYRWWVLPDLTRTQAITKWKPKITLRTGLAELIR